MRDDYETGSHHSSALHPSLPSLPPGQPRRSASRASSSRASTPTPSSTGPVRRRRGSIVP